MKKLLTIFSVILSIAFAADVSFEEMLEAAKKGDDTARVVVAYSYYLGEYRDGLKVEKDLVRAYAWATLANYQGNEEAKKLVLGVIPKLPDRKKADEIAAEYFKLYGAQKDSVKKRAEEPNQSPQRNAGSRPRYDDSPASESPSSLGPRG